ncbi:TPA: hypothetical protein NKQ44_004691 [Vibrio parahaemolyticus]|nr:hypothetical protein [Vibrio parahaemolyticus]HCH1614075.1 hypothetical protein [Vibrio parahaemolyticus]
MENIEQRLSEKIADSVVPAWSKQAQINIAISLAALLVTASAITLPMMSAVTNVAHPYLNDIFWFVGVGAVITSALLIDWVLDESKLNFQARLHLMGKGYLAFAILISLISFAVTAQFYTLEYGEQHTSIFSTPFAFFFFASLSVFAKVMTEDDQGMYIWGIGIFYAISYWLIKMPEFWL